MKKSLSFILAAGLALVVATGCGNDTANNLCAFEFNCASSAWCESDGRTIGSCMAPHETKRNNCEIALENFWYSAASCTDLYNNFYNCVTRHVACTDAQDVYLNRLHSVEQNECRSEYYKLLEDCVGL